MGVAPGGVPAGAEALLPPRVRLIGVRGRLRSVMPMTPRSLNEKSTVLNIKTMRVRLG